MEDRCVICGEIVPEGTEVCPQCVKKWLPQGARDTEGPEQEDLRTEKRKRRGDRAIDLHKLHIK